MKYVCKFFILIFIFLFLFSSCVQTQGENRVIAEEMRGVWVSIFDLPLPVKNEDRFRQDIGKMFDDIRSKNLNNVFVQVRPYSDAFYRSDIFPFSSRLTGVQGKDPGFDPMEIMIYEAHSRSLKFHAWINPYRVLSGTTVSMLSPDNPAYKLLESDKGDVYVGSDGIYYNPASLTSQKLIIDGVREIVKNYDVDGIHIDDYFYPSTDEEIDKKQFSEYGGDLDLEKWRMMNVNSFVSGMFSAVKTIDKNVIVSISPSGDIESCYTSHFADVKKWMSEDGYADLIIPQIYFGFENEKNPFEKTLLQWTSLPRNKNVNLAIGLALYKAGQEDVFAGSGINEWIEHNDVIKRQVLLCKNYDYVFFSYSYTFGGEWDNYLTCR